MTAQDPLLGQPLGARRPHPLLVDRVEQRRSHDLDVGAGEWERRRDPRQQQVPGPLSGFSVSGT